MKKTIRLSALLLCTSLFFVSCSSNEKPEDVAKQFSKAIQEKKWEEALKLSDDNTKGIIKLMESFTKMGEQMGSDTTNKKVEENLEFVKSEVTDSSAIVYFKDKTTSKEEQIPLKKINGKWLVAMKKEGMGDGSAANAAIDTTSLQHTADTTLQLSADTSAKK